MNAGLPGALSNGSRVSAIRVYLHFRWPLAPNSAPLTVDLLARLSPYLTRYGQALGVTVFAVGGASDHVHVLLQMPRTQTINELTDELQAAAVRFLRDVLKVPNFAWHETDGGSVASVDANTLEALGEYIHTNWHNHVSGAIVPYWEDTRANDTEGEPDASLPQWLLEALEKRQTESVSIKENQ